MDVLNCPLPHRCRSSVPTLVSARSSTSRRIQLCRWIWAYLLNVFGHGDGRGQEDGRELEGGCGRDPYIPAVASLISVSIQDIRQNPQDTSNFYLANIYQTLIDSSRSNVTSSLPALSPPFSPPTYTVWVNALWFLSLVISLTCALLATLLQQWAQRYLKVTQSRYSPHKRSRIRAFLAEEVDKLLFPWTVEVLLTLLHISLFLFFAGLVVFLWNVDLTIFRLVFSWVGVCTALYGCITVMPIFRHDSPYVVASVAHCYWDTISHISGSSEAHTLEIWPMARAWHAEDSRGNALDSPSDRDTRAFLWTFDCLDEDHELERFFSGLPGFRNSKVVEDPLPSLTEYRKVELFRALTELLDRTCSSDLLPEAVKNRRAILCTKAIDPEVSPDACLWILDKVFRDQHEGLRTAEVGHIVRDWRDILIHPSTEMVVPAVLTRIVLKAQQRNDSWFILASDELGIPEAVLRDYATRGDSLSLAIVIHVTRQQFSHFQKMTWPWDRFLTALEVVSKFEVQDTLPELQYQFCTLWNQIVRRAHNDNDQRMASYILGPIRNVYRALHQVTSSTPTQFSSSTSDWDVILPYPFSYSVCNIPDHHPNSTPHIHDYSASTTFTPAAPHDHDNYSPAPSLLASSPDTPSFSTHSLLHVDETVGDALPLDNNAYIPVSLDPVVQATTESGRIPATSPDPGSTRAIHGRIDTSTRMAHLSTLELSAFASAPKSNLKASPPDTVGVEHTADTCAPSDGLDGPSSGSATPVFDDMLPSESHVSILASASPFTFPPPSTSEPDLRAPAEDESNAKAGVRKDDPRTSLAVQDLP